MGDSRVSRLPRRTETGITGAEVTGRLRLNVWIEDQVSDEDLRPECKDCRGGLPEYSLDLCSL